MKLKRDYSRSRLVVEGHKSSAMYYLCSLITPQEVSKSYCLYLLETSTSFFNHIFSSFFFIYTKERAVAKLESEPLPDL